MRFNLDAAGPTLYSPLLRQAMILAGNFMLGPILKRMEAAPRQNMLALKRILSRNAQTWFGRDRGFDEVLRADDPESAYRQLVPVATYSHFEPYLTRMAAGEQNVLCVDQPRAFSFSSGTTGPAKLLPVVKANQSLSVAFMGFISHAVALREFAPGTAWERGICLLSTALSGRKTAGGYEIGTSSALGMRQMGSLIEHLWCSPAPVFDLQDEDSAWYLHALFGLRNRNTQYISATFSGIVVQWLMAMFRRWDELLQDIEYGTLTPNLDLPAGLRAQLEKSLAPDPRRAEELFQASRGGFGMSLPRIWPRMKYIQTVTTGAFAVYLPMLQKWAGGLPIYSDYYGCSELILGMSLWPTQMGSYALPVGAGYYEFISSAETGTDSPKTVGIADLRPGEQYELVITNFAGLYRYRVGDIITVEGFYGKAPLMSFNYRRETVIDMLGEKTTEAQTKSAVSKFAENWLGQSAFLKDYTLSPDWSADQPRYVFYLEFMPEKMDEALAQFASMAQALDEAMRQSNILYDHKRRLGLIAQARVKLLSPGAFERLRVFTITRSDTVNRNQVKIPRCIKDSARLDLLDQDTVAQG